MTERDDKWDPSGKGDGSVRDRIESYRSVVDSSARRFVTPAEKMRTMAREIFDKIDVDNSGSLTADELALLMRKAGKPMSSDQLVKTMQELDADGSGEVVRTRQSPPVPPLSSVSVV